MLAPKSGWSFIDLDVSFGDIGVIGQHMVGYTDETDDVMKQAGIADKRDFIGSKAHVNGSSCC